MQNLEVQGLKLLSSLSPQPFTSPSHQAYSYKYFALLDKFLFFSVRTFVKKNINLKKKFKWQIPNLYSPLFPCPYWHIIVFLFILKILILINIIEAISIAILIKTYLYTEIMWNKKKKKCEWNRWTSFLHVYLLLECEDKSYKKFIKKQEKDWDTRWC